MAESICSLEDLVVEGRTINFISIELHLLTVHLNKLNSEFTPHNKEIESHNSFCQKQVKKKKDVALITLGIITGWLER